MAGRRMISRAIWEDEWFGQLEALEQVIWIGLFSRCADDQGRFRDNALLVRSALFPYRNYPPDEIGAALVNFAEAGRILRYEVNAKRYVQIVHWWEHQQGQWAAASEYPAPEGWDDRIRTRTAGQYVEHNWQRRRPAASGEKDADATKPEATPSGEGSPEPVATPSGEGSPLCSNPVPRTLSPLPDPVPRTLSPLPDPIPDPVLNAITPPIVNTHTTKPSSNGQVVGVAFKPFDVFTALCDETGTEPGSVPKSAKNITLRFCKEMLDAGHSPDRIVRCYRYLSKERWRDGPVDAATLKAICVERLKENAPRFIMRMKELPRNAAGKILRDKLTRMAIATGAARTSQ